MNVSVTGNVTDSVAVRSSSSVTLAHINQLYSLSSFTRAWCVVSHLSHVWYVSYTGIGVSRDSIQTVSRVTEVAAEFDQADGSERQANSSKCLSRLSIWCLVGRLVWRSFCVHRNLCPMIAIITTHISLDDLSQPLLHIMKCKINAFGNKYCQMHLYTCLLAIDVSLEKISIQ